MLTPRRGKPERPWLAIVLFLLAGVVVLATFLLQDSFARLGVALTSSTAPGALLTGIGMIGCGASMYAQPSTRVLAGWMGGALALVALPAANFGGFILGTVLGVLGTAAALSWSEGDRKSVKFRRQPAAEPEENERESGTIPH